MPKIAKMVAWVCLALVLIQVVPYGRSHDNPPVVAEPAWSSPQTRALAQRACFDCHSNETVWPWYSQVAPISWGVQRDVDDGRWVMNFSDWTPVPAGITGAGRLTVGQMLGRVMQEGQMPPAQYLLFHPAADLNPAERAQLVQGFAATFDGLSSW